MLIKQAPVLSSDITPKNLYLRRREFLQAAGVTIAAGLTAGLVDVSGADEAQTGHKLAIAHRGKFATDERLTPYKDVTSYNNFYELGPTKEAPALSASTLKPRPWTVKIDGLVNKPANYPIDDLITPHALEERIYRMRCVEGWSMVIPWVGFPLADLIKRVDPQSKAQFVEFTTLYNPAMMPGQRRDVLDYPYVEGLRMDEAMHPLTILAVGLYGEVLPNQNGAPLRLVVPWKYGFKGIKSIVRIRFTEKAPVNSWQRANPTCYGFYANVNPTVDTPLINPRHLQARERRLGEFFMRPTLMFNGYADQVATLYSGMDLRKNF